MQTIRPLMFFVFLLATYISEGQQLPSKTIRRPYYDDDWNFNNRVAIKITPTSLADPYGGLLPIGLEYYFENKYGVSLDIGIPLFYSINNSRYGHYKDIHSDFKLRADFRQYFGFGKCNRFFAGAEVFYRNQNMELQNSYFHFIDNNCYPFTSAKAIKNIVGFGVIAGITHKCSDHFFLEGNIGAGIRIINMTPNWDMNASAPFVIHSFVSLELPNEDRVGDHDVNIYIPFAIKVAYMF